MTPQDELLIDKFIEHEIRLAIGKGHDRETTYSDRQDTCGESLAFMNTYWFDVYCLFLGYDPNRLRWLIRDEAVKKIAEMRKFLLHQIEMINRDTEIDVPEKTDYVFQYGLLLEMECV